MATLVTFHAHPDDECIGTGGVMRKAADEGHRVVLVVATNGERGLIPDGLLDDGETLAQRRIAETHESARLLGVARTESSATTIPGWRATRSTTNRATSGSRTSTRPRSDSRRSCARRTRMC